MDKESLGFGLYDITSITPTVCELMDVTKPINSSALPINDVIVAAKNLLNSKVQKCLIFAPDAIGLKFYEKYRSKFNFVEKYSTLNVNLCSIFPPKTPVCFASMFTGTTPEVHGIKEYEKPVLKCDTIFDAMLRENKKVAIIAVNDSSIDKIFRQREIEYYSERNDIEVTDKTIDCLIKKQYDFIVVYQQDYDDQLHKTSPESKPALQALDNHINNFKQIAETIETSWKKYNHLVIFSPDHGAHYDPEKNIGFHGKNIPEDMLVKHFFTIKRKH